ncbi:MAG: hypothetical protein SGARI_001346, partial [Bacillariaceae sp.]
MKFTSFATIAAALVAAAPFASAQSTLEEKWAIGDDPAFTYDSLDFSLTFPITDFIVQGQSQYTLYTAGCQEDGTELGAGAGITGAAIVDTANTVSESDVTMDQSATINMSVDPTTISGNSDLYSEDTTI